MLRRILLLLIVVMFGTLLYIFKISLWISCPIGVLLGWYFDDIMDKLGVPKY